MLKKTLSVLLIALLLNLAAMSSVYADGGNPEKNAKFAEKVRSNIKKLGTGADAKIEVKLKDKTKIKGYVSESDDEKFTVIDKDTGQARTILYPQVRQAKGNNLSSRVVFAIGFAALFVVLIILLASDNS